MIQGKRVLAVVPARGGSKGIPLKNLRKVGGVSLIGWVARVIAQIPSIDRAVVSTDHEEIARTAEMEGLSAPFRRPVELSGDQIADVPVLLHALECMEKMDKTTYDIIIMLQPTSPLRTADEIERALQLLLSEKAEAVWTVSLTDSKAHPLKQLTVSKDDGQLDYYDPRGRNVIARQQLQPVYHRNGVAYVITRDCLVVKKSLKGDSTKALVLEGKHISIDTEEDIEFVNYWLEKKIAVKV